MISKIINRAACLAELTFNPKSFFNCPDLHGGVSGRAFSNDIDRGGLSHAGHMHTGIPLIIGREIASDLFAASSAFSHGLGFPLP
jgi:hypothetical protein